VYSLLIEASIRSNKNEYERRIGAREVSLREVMIALLNEQWTKILPEIATNVHRIVKKVTGNVDPYSQLKNKYNRMALKLYPKLKLAVERSKDPLLTAAKVAVAGNVIDFGSKTNINLEEEVEKVLNNELAINDIDQLKKAVLNYKKVLYLADNAGETVFDRVLIEELSKLKVKVTYAVKEAPILNDATFQDADKAGIPKKAKVVSIGTDCTGILFKECSKTFLREFRNSNLIISKGQGNYKSLNDVKNKEVFFLLEIKCPIIAEDIGAKTGSIILMTSFTNC